jgi:pyruvate,water dikinase
MREFGALLARFGILADPEDVFQLHHTEVDQALSDVMLAWAAGAPPLGAAHFGVHRRPGPAPGLPGLVRAR